MPSVRIIRLERRKYGDTTFTWAYVQHNGEYLSLGDPWQGNPPPDQLAEAARATIAKAEGRQP